MSTETQEKQPSQEAIDFLFAAKMHGKITEGIQTNHEVQMLVTDILKKQVDHREVIDSLQSQNLSMEKLLKSPKYTPPYISGISLDDDFKSKILNRMMRQLSLTEVETIEKYCERYPNYNPHI